MTTIRGKEVNFNLKNIFLFHIYILQDIYPLLLAHHPLCDHYKRHTLQIGTLRFCIGCFFLYPIGALLIVVLFFVNLFVQLEWFYLMIIAAALYSSIILKLLHLTHNRIIKVLVAMFLGGGIGTSFWALVLSPIPLWVSIPAFILLNVGFAFFGIKRIESYKKTCMACEFKGAWDKCPGVKEQIDKLQKDGLDVVDQLKYGFRSI